MQQLQSLRRQGIGAKDDARDIATGPIETGDQACSDRIEAGHEDDRRDRCRGQQRDASREGRNSPPRGASTPNREEVRDRQHCRGDGRLRVDRPCVRRGHTRYATSSSRV